MLVSNNYKKIGESNNSYNLAKWKEKAGALFKIPKENRTITIELKGATGDEDAKLLEKICNEIKITESKMHEDKEFEKIYNQAKDWCFTK